MAVAVAADPQAPNELSYVLVGTVIAGDQQIALLRSAQGPEIIEVHAGDEIEVGQQLWSVGEVEGNHLVYRNALTGLLAPRVVDEYAPHGHGRRTEEMGPVLPIEVVVAEEP